MEWILGIIGVFLVVLGIAVFVYTHQRNKNPAATPIKWEAAAVSVAVLASIGSALLAIAGLIGNGKNPSAGPEPTTTVTVTPNPSPPPEPKITISSAEWRDDAKDPGMYRAKGHADLQKGQVVYLFNAQVQKDGTTAETGSATSVSPVLPRIVAYGFAYLRWCSPTRMRTRLLRSEKASTGKITDIQI